MTATDLGSLKYFRMVSTTLAVFPVTVSRTGYTGDSRIRDLARRLRCAAPVGRADRSRHPYGITSTACWRSTSHARGGLMLMDVNYVPARRALIVGQTSSPYRSISHGR